MVTTQKTLSVVEHLNESTQLQVEFKKQLKTPEHVASGVKALIETFRKAMKDASTFSKDVYEKEIKRLEDFLKVVNKGDMVSEDKNTHSVTEAMPKSTHYVCFDRESRKVVGIGSKSAMVKLAESMGGMKKFGIGMTGGGSKVGDTFGQVKESIVIDKIGRKSKSPFPDYKGSVKVRDIRVGGTFKVNKKKDKDDGNEVFISAVKPKDQTVIVKFGGKHGTRHGQYKWDELSAITEEVVNTDSIPQGAESVAKPDFKFKGHDGFDCSPDVFGKCLQGKDKHKQWNTYLDRNDKLVGRVQEYMGQSYKNKNFVLRNKQTGEMVMARKQ